MNEMKIKTKKFLTQRSDYYTERREEEKKNHSLKQKRTHNTGRLTKNTHAR